MALSLTRETIIRKVIPTALTISGLFGIAAASDAIQTAVWKKDDGAKVLTDRKYTNVTGGDIRNYGCSGRFGRDYEASDINGNQVKRRVCFGSFNHRTILEI